MPPWLHQWRPGRAPCWRGGTWPPLSGDHKAVYANECVHMCEYTYSINNTMAQGVLFSLVFLAKCTICQCSPFAPDQLSLNTTTNPPRNSLCQLWSSAGQCFVRLRQPNVYIVASKSVTKWVDSSLLLCR